MFKRFKDFLVRTTLNDQDFVVGYDGDTGEEIRVIVSGFRDSLKGAPGASAQIQFSANLVNWHFPAMEGDVYIRFRVGLGAWSVSRFVGRDGRDGNDGKDGNDWISIRIEKTARPEIVSVLTNVFTKNVSNVNFLYRKEGETDVSEFEIIHNDFTVGLETDSIYYCRIVADVDGYGTMSSKEYVFRTDAQAYWEIFMFLESDSNIDLNGQSANDFTDEFLSVSTTHFADEGLKSPVLIINGNEYEVQRTGDCSLFEENLLFTNFGAFFPATIFDAPIHLNNRIFMNTVMQSYEIGPGNIIKIRNKLVQ